MTCLIASSIISGCLADNVERSIENLFTGDIPFALSSVCTTDSSVSLQLLRVSFGRGGDESKCCSAVSRKLTASEKPVLINLSFVLMRCSEGMVNRLDNKRRS